MAELLARPGQIEPARTAYGRAIAMATPPADRAFLAARLAAR